MAIIVNRKNIIAAAIKVNSMGGDKIQELILKLLETNPTIVLRALEVGTPSRRRLCRRKPKSSPFPTLGIRSGLVAEGA